MSAAGGFVTNQIDHISQRLVIHAGLNW